MSWPRAVVRVDGSKLADIRVIRGSGACHGDVTPIPTKDDRDVAVGDKPEVVQGATARHDTS